MDETPEVKAYLRTGDINRIKIRFNQYVPKTFKTSITPYAGVTVSAVFTGLLHFVRNDKLCSYFC